MSDPITIRCAGKSFSYTPGLSPEAWYNTAFARAWEQRQAAPRAYIRRLTDCGFFILLSLGAMLRCFEFTPLRVYTLFRAQHNAFYGKNRPYRR